MYKPHLCSVQWTFVAIGSPFVSDENKGNRLFVHLMIYLLTTSPDHTFEASDWLMAPTHGISTFNSHDIVKQLSSKW